MIVTLTILMSVLAIATLWLSFRQVNVSRLFTLLVAVSLLLFTSNAPVLAQTQIAALGASDETVTRDETDLKMVPTGSHYTGIEYAKETKPLENPVSDDVIEKTIKSNTDKGVVVAVANGSVRLTGKVDNQRKAERLLSQVKEIPGVHEITFDFALE